ncbi:MAG: sodium-dependent transporter, partial [Pseudomonadota bacterium]
EGASPAWSVLGWVGMIGAFLILTFYSVIAGWVLAYIAMLVGDLAARIGTDGLGALAAGAFANDGADAIGARLGALLTDSPRMILFHAIFMAATVFLVARGLKGGIEAAVKFMMPAFFVMLLALVGFSLLTGDAVRGINYLFGVRPGELIGPLSDGSIIVSALGQAFFSLSLGSAMMITYGSYMTRDTDIPRTSRFVAISDTGVALLAGLAIFPIVFQAGIDPAGGPTLLFQALPIAFNSMPGGGIVALVFFILAFFAAVTSSIALLEASVSYVDERSQGNHRVVVAITLGAICFAIGVVNALSQNPNSPVSAIALPDAVPLLGGKNLLDFFDTLTGNILLPLAAFLTALFAGWAVSATSAREELGFKSEAWFARWRFLVRWVCPIAIGAILIYGAVVAPLLG